MKNSKILIIVFIFLIGFSSGILAQTDLDSLISLSKESTDDNKRVVLLNKIANQLRYSDIEAAYQYLLQSQKLALKLDDWDQLAESYILQGIIWQKRKQLDSSFFYLQKGLNISKEYENYNGILKSLNSLGLNAYIKKDFNNALVYYKDALLIVDKVTKQETIIMLYNNIAMLHKSIGEYDLAIEFYHKALIICDEINDLKGKGIVCSNLGLLYEKQGKYSEAIEYLFESLEIRQSRNNLIGESIVLNNLGVVYEGMDDYEKALEYYRLSLRLKKQLNHKSGIAKIYNNVGIIYKNIGVPDSAHVYFNKSLEINLSLNNQTGVSHTYTNIGNLYKQERNFKKAIKYFNNAAQIAERDNDIQELIRIYKGLFASFNAIGLYKEAFEYSYKYQMVHDSIYNLRSKRYIEEVEGKYQNLKKEKENQALLKDNQLKDEKLKKQVVIGLLIVLVTILILAVLLVVVRSKSRLERINNLLSQKNGEIEKQKKKLKKANKELIKLNSFKENMTNMIAHDLKNPLNSIINISKLKSLESKQDLIQQAGSQILNLISNMIDVYKNEHTKMVLYKNETLLSDIINKALSDVEYISNYKELKVEFIWEFNAVVQIDEEIIKRVFVNLLTNAIKFSPQKGIIKIRYEVDVSKELKISVENQGEGIPQDIQGSIFELYKQQQKQKMEPIPSSGLGLAFCKIAIEAHLGRIGVISESEKDVIFWFTLPDYQVKENTF
jgi:signal transduction histidine kinase